MGYVGYAKNKLSLGLSQLIPGFTTPREKLKKITVSGNIIMC
jgi:hypothetical protein